MFPCLVVVRKPPPQTVFALVGRLILSRVRPFVYQRLYEALGLAVGLRACRSFYGSHLLAGCLKLADFGDFRRSPDKVLVVRIGEFSANEPNESKDPPGERERPRHRLMN